MPKVIEDDAVFKAVMQTIVERGYAGATTKQMAEAANVSEVTLFRKYDSKLNLVKQAISVIVEQTDFEAAIQYTGDIQTDLLNVLFAYENSVVLHGQFFAVLFSEISRNPELANSLDQPINLFSSIGELMSRYQMEGILREEHPLHAVAALLGPLIYTSMIRSSIPDGFLPPMELKNHVKYFLEGRYAYSTSE
jgi:AcrR family transcriptional regulator